MGLRKEYSKEFEYFFWAVYPKRVGKEAAAREFDKLKLSEDEMRELREHIELRKRKDRKWVPNERGATFIVDPERFLKHRRFEDEYETVRPQNGSTREKRYYDVEQEPGPEHGLVDAAIARRHIAESLAMLKGGKLH